MEEVIELPCSRPKSTPLNMTWTEVLLQIREGIPKKSLANEDSIGEERFIQVLSLLSRLLP